MQTAVYAGTFDPITAGHLDVIMRGSKLFDKLIVAVAGENYKENMFTLDERVDLIQGVIQDIPNVEVAPFTGLLVDYCVNHNACAIIRGLRAVSDFEKEFQMALLNKKMCPKVETVFLTSSQECMFISSSIIKKSFALGGNVTGLIPEAVEHAMKEKLLLKKKLISDKIE